MEGTGSTSAEAPETMEPEAVPPATRGGAFPRYAGWIGVLAALLGVGGVLAATILCGAGCGAGAVSEDNFAADGSFTWSSNALSDLGVSQVALLFNGTLVLAGILNFLFAVGFVQAYARGLLFYVGGVLLIGGGASLALVGILSEDFGSLHTYVSLGYFLLFPFAMLLVGVAFYGMGRPALTYGSLLLGLLALVVILSSVATGWHDAAGLGFAVPEMIEALFIAAWVVWMGVTLAREA